LVPADVDPMALARVIAAKLRADGYAGSDRSSGLSNLLERTPDVRIVVPRIILERLGGGAAERGERLIRQIVEQIRSRDMPRRGRTGSDAMGPSRSSGASNGDRISFSSC
jgi:hypothetical protein